jgi:hypothetical protein
VNAILFRKDGTTRTIENVQPSTYLDMPVYVPAGELMLWQSDGVLPNNMMSYQRRRYIKQMESPDFAVFTEE